MLCYTQAPSILEYYLDITSFQNTATQTSTYSFKLRSELTNTQNRLSHSNTQRQRLEVNMRRTLLQGMTAMNVETMALFKDSAAEVDS